MKTQVITFILLITGIWLPGNHLVGQDTEKKGESRFGFDLGFSHSQVKDYALIQLAHKGPGFRTGFVFTRVTSKNNHRLSLNGGFNSLKSSFEEEAGTYLLNTSLKYRYSRRIVSFNEKSKLFLGGRIALEATQGIYENWDENHYYWLTGYSLGVNGLYSLSLPDDKLLTCEISLPILTLASRTPGTNLRHEEQAQFSAIISRVHENPKAATWPDHFAVEVRMSYHYDVRGKFWQSVFWQFNHVNNKIAGSDRIRMIDHEIGFEFLF